MNDTQATVEALYERWMDEAWHAIKPGPLRSLTVGRNFRALIIEQERYRIALLDDLVRRAGVTAGETVLNLAYGGGPYAFSALPLVGTGGRVLFTDMFADFVERCRRVVDSGPWAARAEYSVLPDLAHIRHLGDASTDAIVGQAMIDPSRGEQSVSVLRDVRRTLRMGGRLAISVDLYDSSPNSLLACLKSAGFTEVHTDSLNFRSAVDKPRYAPRYITVTTHIVTARNTVRVDVRPSRTPAL